MIKALIPAAAACVLLCQCETVASPDDRRESLTNSGLSPAEREQRARDTPLSDDPSDPLNKVRAADNAVGVSILEF